MEHGPGHHHQGAQKPLKPHTGQLAKVVRGGGGADASCARLQYMFNFANSFNQPVGAWNMAKVTDTSVRRSPSNHTRSTDGEGGAGRRRR